jgi:hypothetical protein
MLLQSLMDRTPEDHHDYQDLKVRWKALRHPCHATPCGIDWMTMMNCLWMQSAIILVSAAATHNNEHIRKTQNTEKLREIQLNFEENTDINLFDSPQRTFVREGSLIKSCRRGEGLAHDVFTSEGACAESWPPSTTVRMTPRPPALPVLGVLRPAAVRAAVRHLRGQVRAAPGDRPSLRACVGGL